MIPTAWRRCETSNDFMHIARKNSISVHRIYLKSYTITLIQIRLSFQWNPKKLMKKPVIFIRDCSLQIHFILWYFFLDVYLTDTSQGTWALFCRSSRVQKKSYFRWRIVWNKQIFQLPIYFDAYDFHVQGTSIHIDRHAQGNVSCYLRVHEKSFHQRTDVPGVWKVSSKVEYYSW